MNEFGNCVLKKANRIKNQMSDNLKAKVKQMKGNKIDIIDLKISCTEYDALMVFLTASTIAIGVHLYKKYRYRANLKKKIIAKLEKGTD